MTDVGALEDLGEDGNDPRARKIVRDEEGDLAVGVESVLIGSDLHTAAEVASVCNRSEPDALICLCDSVDRDGGVAGLEIIEKPLERDRRVIDRFFLFLALAVADFADVAVNTEADVVDEGVFLAVDAYEGEIFYVLGKLEGSGTALESEVIEKVVAASGAVVVYRLLDVKSAGVIDEMVQCAVASREDDDAVVVAGNEKVVVAAHRGDVDVAHLAVGQDIFERVCVSLGFAVVCKGVV